VLLAAIAVSLAAFLVTERVVDASSAREIAPVLLFAAALAAPAAPPPGAALTAWLESHRLPGAGLGGYWQASVVTLTSGGTVAIRPIADDGGGIGQYTIWYWPTQNLLSTVRR
jgi:hypothetical protein